MVEAEGMARRRTLAIPGMIERRARQNPRRSKPTSSPLAVLVHGRTGRAEVVHEATRAVACRAIPGTDCGWRGIAARPGRMPGSIRTIRYWRLRFLSGIRPVMQ